MPEKIGKLDVPMTRRTALALGGGMAATVALAAVVPGLFVTPAAAEVTAEELLKPGDLPEIAIGKPDAPVTVIEYASLTCGHCATFHTDVYPEFKKKYVDSGQVRLILRDFPLDNLAAAAAMLVRCQEPAKGPEIISALFQKRSDWVVPGNPLPQLFATVQPLGVTKEQFDSCITDQKLLEKIAAARQRASGTFGVNSTPTFFINGKKHTGGPTLAELSKMIDPLLNKS